MVISSLGRLGGFQLAYDYNGHSASSPPPYGISWNPIRASLTLDAFDRLFVRGTAYVAPRTWREPGFGVEVGGRL